MLPFHSLNAWRLTPAPKQLHGEARLSHTQIMCSAQSFSLPSLTAPKYWSPEEAGSLCLSPRVWIYSQVLGGFLNVSTSHNFYFPFLKLSRLFHTEFFSGLCHSMYLNGASQAPVDLGLDYPPTRKTAGSSTFNTSDTKRVGFSHTNWFSSSRQTPPRRPTVLILAVSARGSAGPAG